MCSRPMMPAKRANGLLKPNTEPNATVGEKPARARRECRHRRRCFRLEGGGPLTVSESGGDAQGVVETSAAPRRRLAQAGFEPETIRRRCASPPPSVFTGAGPSATVDTGPIRVRGHRGSAWFRAVVEVPHRASRYQRI